MKLIGEQEKIIMRNPDRIPVILEAIQKSWEANPDLRLMQLLLNAIDFKNPFSELYHLEDDVLMSRLQGDVK